MDEMEYRKICKKAEELEKKIGKSYKEVFDELSNDPHLLTEKEYIAATGDVVTEEAEKMLEAGVPVNSVLAFIDFEATLFSKASKLLFS